MKRCFLPILLMIVVMMGCGKTQSGLAQYRAQAAVDDKIVANYIAQNNLTGVVQKVSDTCGVYYEVINPGQGTNLYTLSTQVTVSYVGKLLSSGKVFGRKDSSAFTPYYILGQTILGWQLGIPKIQKGGEVHLIVPSRYAYGPYAQPQLGLPANAILDFDIKLYDITN